jgi:alcohol dehydrogenase class IV
MTTESPAPSELRSFACPTRVLYGVGSSGQVGREVVALGGRRCLLVTEPGVAAIGVADAVERSLLEAGLAVSVYDGVVPNPEVESVDAGASAARQVGADVLVGVGGGSSLDTAKLIGLLVAANETSVYRYFGDPVVSRPILPLVAIPTTAGTGSEVAWAAIVNKKSTGERLSLVSARLAARLAIVDPTFAARMPPRLAAGTGMDALAHAVEGFTSKRATPFGEAFAAEAIRLIGGSLVPLVEEPGNLEAAERMALAATMAGLVLNLSSVNLGHALARPLSAWYGVHHGLSVGIVLPRIVAFNAVGNEDRFARIAHLLGVGDGRTNDRELARVAVEAVDAIRRRIGIPETLAEVGVPAGDADRLTENVLSVPGLLNANPRPVTRADVKVIYESLLLG